MADEKDKNEEAKNPKVTLVEKIEAKQERLIQERKDRIARQRKKRKKTTDKASQTRFKQRQKKEKKKQKEQDYKNEKKKQGGQVRYGLKFKKKFIAEFKARGNHLTDTLKALNVSYTWFNTTLTKDEKFRNAYVNCFLECSEDVRSSLLLEALKGNVQAIKEWFDRFDGAMIDLRLRMLRHLRKTEESRTLSKSEHLNRSIDRLELVFYTAMLRGNTSQAIQAQKEINNILTLQDANELENVELLTGDKLIGIMKGLGIEADVDDINFEDLDDMPEDIQKVYGEMFPQQLNPANNAKYEA